MASHWGTLANLGTHFGHLRLHWGVLELPWGCFGDDFGLFWASSEKKLSVGTPPQADGSQVPRLRTKTDPLEFACRSRGSRGNGPRTTVQDLPSTRAGDQDDVSFTNSLKLNKLTSSRNGLTGGPNMTKSAISSKWACLKISEMFIFQKQKPLRERP